MTQQNPKDTQGTVFEIYKVKLETYLAKHQFSEAEVKEITGVYSPNVCNRRFKASGINKK